MTPEQLEKAYGLDKEIENYNSILLRLNQNPSVGIIVSGIGIHSALTMETRKKITNLIKEDLESLLAGMESEFKSL